MSNLEAMIFGAACVVFARVIEAGWRAIFPKVNIGLIRAFVQGAAWWCFHDGDTIMRDDDKRIATAYAVRLEAQGNLGSAT